MRSFKTEPPRILLAEDDRALGEQLTRRFQREGYSVTSCSDAHRFADIINLYLQPQESDRYDVIVCDIRILAEAGMENLEAANMSCDFPPMILLTAFGAEKTRETAERLGATAFVAKPFDADRLVALVRKTAPLWVRLYDLRVREREET